MKTGLIAHEVYVLDTKEITAAMTDVSPNPFTAIQTHTAQFGFSAIIVIALVLVAMRVAFTKKFEVFCAPAFKKAKKYAPIAVLVTLVASVISLFFKPWFFGDAFIIYLQSGVLLPYLALLVYFIFYKKSYRFFALRIVYGLSIVYFALFAKFMYSNLAFATVTQYHLTDYLGFDPTFFVLGAFLIEIVVGICILIGFELHLATAVFTFVLIAANFFFKEPIGPHLILLGLNSALFLHGYDRYTVFGRFSKKGLEPIL